ncbi:MAG TPA: hypothetical protein VK060_13825 [Ruania sp.]|nr:hypothetical protein [Ruania sp.]
MSTPRRRCAVIGTGARAGMYRPAITETFAHASELTAVCQPNPSRAAHYANQLGAQQNTSLVSGQPVTVAELDLSVDLITTDAVAQADEAANEEVD